MDKISVLKTLKQAREGSQKRNFSQTFDLVINLKDLDIKKVDNQIEFFMSLPQGFGKQSKICALVGPELETEAKNTCDRTILIHEFDKLDKIAIKKLAEEHRFFIAQATIMPKVAQYFGRVLGPRAKMPNPKSGCVVPPKVNLKPLYDKLQKTVKISTKTSTIIQIPVGIESMSDDAVVENVIAAYDQIVAQMPGHDNNIRSMMLKLTMGKPARF